MDEEDGEEFEDEEYSQSHYDSENVFFICFALVLIITIISAGFYFTMRDYQLEKTKQIQIQYGHFLMKNITT